MRAAAIAVVFAVLCGACAGGFPWAEDGGDAAGLEAAWQKLRTQLDTTAQAAFPGVPTRHQDAGGDLAGCEVGTDTYQRSYSIFVTVNAEDLAPGVERVRRHWESQGHAVLPSGTELPTLHVDDGGEIEFGLTANARDRRVYLFGTTSCFKVPD